MSDIIIIAAAAENRVIGRENALPWSLKEDMIHFRELTRGWPCIMGRKTWESLPKRPLPGRLNVIVSQRLTMNGDTDTPPGTEVAVCSSLAAALKQCAGWQQIFICGGASIYSQAMEFANRIELTLIHQDYAGDTFFPEIDSGQWTKTAVEDFDTFSFISYAKNRAKNTVLKT